jgi:RNA polymerase sigma factor (sigma-70 family)
MEERSTDVRFLEYLRKGSSTAFEELYRKYYRMAEDLVFRLNGNREDAQDVFQEALFVLVKKLREPGFTLSGKLSTFLYAVIRNIWLKRTGKMSNEVSMDEKSLTVALTRSEVQDGLSASEREILLLTINEKLNELEEGCRLILLHAFYQQLPHAEIARIFGYSEAFVKVRKFRCLEYLRRLVKATDSFKNL